MTPISVHGGKEGGGGVTGKGEEEQTQGKIPLTVGGWGWVGSTEEQQDQIRAFGLFILVNTTPRIYLKF